MLSKLLTSPTLLKSISRFLIANRVPPLANLANFLITSKIGVFLKQALFLARKTISFQVWSVCFLRLCYWIGFYRTFNEVVNTVTGIQRLIAAALKALSSYVRKKLNACRALNLKGRSAVQQPLRTCQQSLLLPLPSLGSLFSLHAEFGNEIMVNLHCFVLWKVSKAVYTLGEADYLRAFLVEWLQ